MLSSKILSQLTQSVANSTNEKILRRLLSFRLVYTTQLFLNVSEGFINAAIMQAHES